VPAGGRLNPVSSDSHLEESKSLGMEARLESMPVAVQRSTLLEIPERVTSQQVEHLIHDVISDSHARTHNSEFF
jgi:hypothetical protein